MGLLKELDCNLARFLELACQDSSYGRSSSRDEEFRWSLDAEFVCCCERARHAIKDFTNQGDDGKASDSFLHAWDALCDLKWCLHICDHFADFSISKEFRQLLFRLMWEIRLPETLGPSVYSSDARNGLGSADLPPGLNLDEFGEIRRLDELGEGAQGKVYKAIWRGVDPVAVKEVFSDTRSEGLQALQSVQFSGNVSAGRSNLDQEFEVLKTLNHPNIVELKGYTRNVSAGKYGLVMELMKCSLEDLITADPISELTSVDMLLQVARGMQFLHTVGIMHRDLKPGNILIGELNYLPPNARRLGYMVAKLADFGLSKQDLMVDGAGWHTYMKGTSFYMAPELRKSGNDAGESRYTRSADVFSFGTTCFNVLTRKQIPCTGEDKPLKTGEFYERIEKGDLDELLYNYRRSKLALLVKECWCRDPNRRPTFLEICLSLEKEKRRMLLENSSPSVSSTNGLGSADLPPGLNVDDLGEIEYLHELGRGAQGKVYKAMWRGVGLVAVKEVFSENRISRVANLQASGVLNHPNIVELKGYTTKVRAGKYGVVMELMKCSLEDLIKAMPFSELVAVDTLLQVARGMEFLHSVGIMHRNLRPANILIQEFKCIPPNSRCLGYVVAKLADFGLSSNYEGAEQGSYIAPEVCLGSTNKARESADVFSFGTTIFNVLTGEEFPCTELGDRIRPLEFYYNMELLDPLMSSDMALLVRRCWSPNPKERPSFSWICLYLEEKKSRDSSEGEVRAVPTSRFKSLFLACREGLRVREKLGST